MSQFANSTPSTATRFSPGGWALIVDDHPMFCDALELTLRSLCNFDQIRIANTVAQAVDLARAEKAPALVVLDLNLPDATGLDGLIKVVAASAPAPVIVVSSITENAVITSALKLGAVGYVPKHSPRTVFRAAIDAISGGRTYVPETYVPTDGPSPQDAALKALASLTPQQTRILELMSDGLLNKQIAHELTIAEATVKAHVTAIMRKLSVHNRTQAVLVAKEAGFAAVMPRG